MNNRLLVDTNILIYAIDADSKFHKKAEELLRKYHPSGLRIHGFEIVSIGLASGIDQIVTRNIDDF